MHVDEAIRNRRSHKAFDGRPVPDPILTELVDLAIWAPNHRRTEPWRFALVSHARMPAFVQAVLDGVAGTLPPDKVAGKQDKLRAIVGTAGAAIGVGYVRSPGDPERDREDFAATACAIQNILLGLHARGYVGYWTTSPALIGPQLAGFWQPGPGEELIGAVLMGGQIQAMPALRQKSAADVSRWV